MYKTARLETRPHAYGDPALSLFSRRVFDRAKRCACPTHIPTHFCAVGTGGLRERLQTTHLSPEVLEGFLFFSFVRDPFSRAVSSYFEATAQGFKEPKSGTNHNNRATAGGRQPGEQASGQPSEQTSGGPRLPGLDDVLSGGGRRWSSNVHFRSQTHQLAAATATGKGCSLLRLPTTVSPFRNNFL